MIGTVDLILFGIQAAVKLAKSGRTIYVEETIRQAITMPLPATFDSFEANVRGYVLGLRGGDARQQALYERDFKADWESGRFRAAEATYLGHVSRGLVRLAPKGTLGAVERERAGLAVLRQWDKSADPLPSPLQRVAGTLVEVAVDYFVNVPGALNEHSKSGRAIKSILQGLDDVEFDEARWDEIVIALFTAGLDALTEHPELFSEELVTADSDKPSLLRSIVTSVADEAKARLKSLEGPNALDAEDRMKKFGGILLTSLISGSARTVIDNPEALGIEDKSGKALVKGVGSAFVELLLGGDVPLAQGLQRLASSGGLERLVHAALRAVAENPEIFRIRKKEVESWLKNVLTDLFKLYPKGEGLFDVDLLASVAHLALEHAKDDLSGLLLKKLSSEQRALVIEVADGVLGAFIEPPGSGKPARWRFEMSRSEVLGIVDSVLKALATHPEWVLRKPSHRALAAAVLPLAVDALSRVGQGTAGGFFKSLLRSGSLESVLGAILTSGILDELKTPEGDTLPADVIAKSLTKVLRAIANDGLAGLDRVLAFDILHDVLLALKSSKRLGDLFPSQGAGASQLIAELAAILSELRAANVVTVSAMVTRLKAA